jgi:guanylate kinase
MKEFDGCFKFSVSHTTRKIRENEKHGVNYYYVSEEEFKNKISKDEFVEWAIYNNNYYGTSKQELEEKKKICGIENSICLLELDIVGANKLHKYNLGFEFIAILPPSHDILKERLLKRGTETIDQIEVRLAIGKSEIDEITNAEYIKYKIINENLEESYKQLKEIIIKLFPDQVETKLKKD